MIFSADFVVDLRIPVFQAQVLQFRLYSVEAQPVGQWSIEVDGFSGNLYLFVARKGIQGSHIVKPVSQFHKDHPDIFGKGEQHFPEILCLQGIGFLVKYPGDLGQSVNDGSDLFPKSILNVLNGQISIFHHIMQNGTYCTGYTQVRSLH